MVNSATASVSIIANTGPTVATAATALPSPVTGKSTALKVLGADTTGGETNLKYTWSYTGPTGVTFSINGTNAAKNTTAAFTQAGSYNFLVTIQDTPGLTITSSVAVVVNQTLTSIKVDPTPISVIVTGTQQFTAVAKDQFGTDLVTQPSFIWAVSGGGSINVSGLYTAGSVAGGPYTASATSGSIKGIAQVTVAVVGTPTIATAASATPSPVVGTTTALSVLGAEPTGGEPALTYTWASTGPAPVTFSINGTNASKNTTATFTRSGNYTFLVTIKAATGLKNTSSVTVTVSRTLTSVAVTPVSFSLPVSGTRQFSAAAQDQFGLVLSTHPAFVWSVSGGGTVSVTGLFTAGSTAGGPFTITSTSGSKSGFARVNIYAAKRSVPTIVTAAAATPSPVTATTTDLSVLGADSDGLETTLTYTWSSTGPAAVTFSVNGTNASKNTTATFIKAGSYTLKATIKDQYDMLRFSSVVVLVKQTVSNITITPAIVSAWTTGTQQFTAVSVDQFGTALSSQTSYIWSVDGGGTISSRGLFTAGSTLGGPYTVTAVLQTTPPIVATAASASPNPTATGSTELSVLGSDLGGEGNLIYTWTSTGPVSPIFSDNGTNTAKNTTAALSKAGTYNFTVTIKNQANFTVTSAVSAVATVNAAPTASTTSTTSTSSGTGAATSTSTTVSSTKQALSSGDRWLYFSFDGSILPVKALEALDKGLSTILGLIEKLMTIIKLIQMFISAFGSLMGAINAFISLVQGQLKSISTSLGSAGVFVNILVPPGFLKNFSLTNMTTGGFDGFLQRLKVSLYNDADKNRPVFKDDGVVGGLLLAADTETLDDFFKAMNFIAGLFSFSNLFPFNISPPPPRNVRAYTGWFKQSDASVKYGIKLQWDAPPIQALWTYRISRSKIDGGVATEKTVIPTRLIGPKGHEEQGLLTAVQMMLYGAVKEWPKEVVQEYSDALQHNIVLASPADGGGQFFDYSIEPDKEATYYYVIESGFPPLLWGPRSPQIIVQAMPTNCVNDNKFGVIVNENGRVEFVSKGVGALGQWSSIKVDIILPFLPTVVKFVNNFLETLKGGLKSNTKAFMDFLQGIVDKFKKYVAMLEAIVTMITALENFFSSAPKIMLLNVPPSSGGVDKFVEKVMGAKRPPNTSGRGGMTVGVCLVYGASWNNPLSGLVQYDPVTKKLVPAPGMEAQMKIIGKAFALISKILKS